MLRLAKSSVSKNQLQGLVRNQYKTSICISSPSVTSLSYRYNTTGSGGTPVPKEIAPGRKTRNASLPRETQLTFLWKWNRGNSLPFSDYSGTVTQRRMLSTGNEFTKFAPVKEAASQKTVNEKGKKEKPSFLVYSLMVFSMIGSLAASPFALKRMKESNYEYDEIDMYEAFYNHIQDAVYEAKGEIMSRMPILGPAWEKSKVAGSTADVLAEVLKSEALQNAVVTLLTNVMESPQFQSASQILLRNLWNDLVTDPETTAQVVLLLNNAIQNEKIKRSFKELIIGLLQDEEVYNEVASLVVKLGDEKEILDATKELLTVSAHKALNDPEILDHSMEFATDVVGDDVVQRTSGEALRNTVTYAVRPSLSTFFSVFGVALLFFSAAALKNAHISAQESKEIDAAASIVLKNVADVVLTTIAKVLAVPNRALSAVGSAILTTLLFPFQIIASSLSMVRGIGGTAFNGLYSILGTVSSIPGMLKDIISLSITTFSNSLQSSAQFLFSTPKLLTEGAVKLTMSISTAIGNFGTSSLKSVKGGLQELLHYINPYEPLTRMLSMLSERAGKLALSVSTAVGDFCAASLKSTKGTLQQLLTSLTSMISNSSTHIRSYFVHVSKASIIFVVTGSKACVDFLAKAGIRMVEVFSNLFKRGRGDENATL